MPKVLYVCLNHPQQRPGGAEQYAYELFTTVRAGSEFNAIWVAKVGPPMSIDAAHPGTRFGLFDGVQDEYGIHTDPEVEEFDRIDGTVRRKRMYIEDWRKFLQIHRPDVVHFHHNMFVGYDMVRETRRTLPDAAIVYTLHEFNSICLHNGQMIRRETYALCDHASPQRCHECFPYLSPQRFFMRERFIKAVFELVDMFIVPSDHARRRYLDWGLPPDKVIHEDYGRIPVAPLSDPPDAGRRKRIGFFGQLTRYKGVDVLLEAMRLVRREDPEVKLLLRGANLDRTEPDFQEKISSLLADSADSVLFTGRYDQAELPGLLRGVDWIVVPSIWWETGPLVIHEALMHHRPVICSNIGAMLERIQEGVNGLHFGVGDPGSLAETILRATGSPELWDRLRAGITEPHAMADHIPVMYGIYNDLLARRSRRPAA